MIYPVPQSINCEYNISGSRAITFHGDCLKIANKVQEQYPIPPCRAYSVEIVLKKCKSTEYIDELSRLTDEKYIIELKEDHAVITAATERGVFRAVHTLLKLNEKHELFVGKITDYPLFEKRGYIEGFYGPTWESEKRRSVMGLMAKYGMNTFYYAPKDDIYHREKWRDFYPEKDSNELKSLFEFAKENQMDFHWCIGPGLTYRYTSEDDFNTLLAKIKSVYDIGVRGFGLLLDDIPDKFQYKEDESAFESVVDAHIDLINKAYSALKRIDQSIKLTVCPTQYHGDESSYYISKLGRSINADIEIFWTGQEICSRILTCRESDDFLRSTGHKPLFWDNYPVNDTEMFQEMHLGALIGRDKELYKHSSGLIANVMEYAECSKIPLITIADYLWNPAAYKPEEAMEAAYREVIKDKEKIEKFKLIADHLCVSCLNRHGSEIMSEKLAYVSFLYATKRQEQAANELSSYIREMYACLEMLENPSVELFNEIKKWTGKFRMCCELLELIYKTMLNPSEQNKSRLRDMLEKYNSDAVILTGFCLREAAEKALNL